MWSTIVTAVSTLFKGWMDLKKSRIEAEIQYNMKMAEIEATWDLIAIRQAQYSWKDEFITIIWFAPLIVAWFYPERARMWLDFVGEMPVWFQFGMYGIFAASFGLRWYFKEQNFRVAQNNQGKAQVSLTMDKPEPSQPTEERSSPLPPNFGPRR